MCQVCKENIGMELKEQSWERKKMAVGLKAGEKLHGMWDYGECRMDEMERT
jgi:hypothetical protein